jgi:hypothetical protein
MAEDDSSTPRPRLELVPGLPPDDAAPDPYKLLEAGRDLAGAFAPDLPAMLKAFGMDPR